MVRVADGLSHSGLSTLDSEASLFSMSESSDSCCDERKMADMHSDSDAYQNAGPVQCELRTLGQEKEAVMIAVMTVAYRDSCSQNQY